MSEQPILTAAEQDALKEVVNIGAGHAATALSQLTRQPIMIHVPRVDKVGAQNMGSFLNVADDTLIVSSAMKLLGPVGGDVVMVFERNAALRFSDLLLGRKKGEATDFDEMEQSSFMEAANIIGSSFMNALADLLDVNLLPSIPTFSQGTPNDLVKQVRSDEPAKTVLCAETSFAFEEIGDDLRGFLLLFSGNDSLAAILSALQKWIPQA